MDGNVIVAPSTGLRRWASKIVYDHVMFQLIVAMLKEGIILILVSLASTDAKLKPLPPLP